MFRAASEDFDKRHARQSFAGVIATVTSFSLYFYAFTKHARRAAAGSMYDRSIITTNLLPQLQIDLNPGLPSHCRKADDSRSCLPTGRFIRMATHLPPSISEIPQ